MLRVTKQADSDSEGLRAGLHAVVLQRVAGGRAHRGVRLKSTRRVSKPALPLVWAAFPDESDDGLQVLKVLL